MRESLSARGVDTVDGNAAIVPVMVGPADKTLALAGRLLDQGILAPGIRPPTVAKGTSRLRLSVMATHSEEDMVKTADAISAAGGVQ